MNHEKIAEQLYSYIKRNALEALLPITREVIEINLNYCREFLSFDIKTQVDRDFQHAIIKIIQKSAYILMEDLSLDGIMVDIRSV
jgi:hypothetical protein